MRLHPRSMILAVALISLAAVSAACGNTDRTATSAAVKAATPDATETAHAASARPTLGSQLQGVVDAGSPGVIALVNDGDGVRLLAAGVAERRTGRALRT